MLKMLDLFSGIGGFSLAAAWTGGIETVAFCEIEPFCQKVLHKHWPKVPIHTDIKELNGRDLVREHGAIDIVCGGFPCQPFSCAGQRRGKDDDRYLWPEMLRVITEVRPTWVVGENVANFVNMALDDCVIGLENENYEVQTFIIPACGVNAPHKRERCWIVAHANNATPTRQREYSGEILSITESKGFSPSCPLMADTSNITNGKTYSAIGPVRSERNTWDNASRSRGGCRTICNWRDTEPAVGRVANGIPHRLDRLKALGNAIVPQVVYPIFQGIVEIERSMDEIHHH